MVAGIVVVVLVAVVGLVVFFVRSRLSMVPAPLRRALEQAGFRRSPLSIDGDEEWERAAGSPLSFAATNRKGVLEYELSCDEDPSALEWLRPFFDVSLVASARPEYSPQPGEALQPLSESLGQGLQLMVSGEGTSLSPAEVDQLLALGRPLAPELRKLPQVYLLLYFRPSKSEATSWWLVVQWKDAATAAELSAAMSVVNALSTALHSRT
jgi:hypothetical protein